MGGDGLSLAYWFGAAAGGECHGIRSATAALVQESEALSRERGRRRKVAAAVVYACSILLEQP